MKFQARLLAVIALVIITSAALAQQQMNPGEAFRFFPDGVYRSFEVCTLLALREAEAYSMYQETAGGKSENVLPDIAKSLPEQYGEQAEYYAYAKALGVEVPVNKESVTVEGDMLLLSIPGLSALIEQDVQEKRLISIGRRLMKRPIYSLEGSGREACFVYATPTDELLMARDPKMIRAMVRADTGRSLRMIDNQEYADLFGYVGDLGQLLMVRSIRASLKPTLESSAEEVGEEALKNAEAAGELVFEIENIFVSDEITMIKHAIFTNEEAAKSHYATFRNPYMQSEDSDENSATGITNQYQNNALSGPTTIFELMLQKREADIDGVIVTTTIHLRADDLRKIAKLNSSQAEEDGTEER